MEVDPAPVEWKMNHSCGKYLLAAARWARILAYSAISFNCAFTVLYLLRLFPGLAHANFRPAVEFSGLSAVVLSVGAWIPCTYLLQFARRIKKAARAKEERTWEKAFLSLLRFFRFFGVLVIAAAFLYLLFLAISFLAAYAGWGTH